MIKTFSEFVVRRAWLLLLGWVLLLALAWFSPRFQGQPDNADLRTLLDANESFSLSQAQHRQSFPTQAADAEAILVFARAEGLTVQDRNRLTKLVNELAELGQTQAKSKAEVVWTVHSPVNEPHLRSRLVATDAATGRETAWMVLVKYNLPYTSRASVQQVEHLEQMVRDARLTDAGMKFEMSGTAGLGRDRTQAQDKTQDRILWMTLLAVLVVLLLVYRAPGAALVPILAIGASVLVANRLLLFLASYGVPFYPVQFIYLIVLLFGVGTDYAMFWLSRYREEQVHESLARLRGRVRVEEAPGANVRYKRRARPLTENEQAARRAGIATIPGLLASCGTTIFGLSLLLISEFRPNQITGPMMALSLAIAMLAALTLTPALALLLGRALFWPGGAGDRKLAALAPASADVPEVPASRFWTMAAGWVTGRPKLVVVCALGLLVVPVALAFRVSYHFDLDGESLLGSGRAPATSLAVRYFGPARLFPWTCLIHLNDPKLVAQLTKGAVDEDESPSASRPAAAPRPRASTKLDAPALQTHFPLMKSRFYSGLTPLEELSRRVMDILRRNGSAEVWSYTEPAGDDIATDDANLPGGLRAFYWNPEQACLRFEVVTKDAPFSREALRGYEASLGQISQMLKDEQISAALYGTGLTAYLSNVKNLADRDNTTVQLVVVLGLGVILVLLIRDPVVPVVMILSSLLVYWATMGLAGLLFTTLLGQGELDWKIKLFSFVVLVAIGQDYNLFFLSRLLEERNHKPLGQAIKSSLAHSGSIISSCGLITAVAMGALCFSEVSFLSQLGFVLVIGLLLDAFLVRPFLLPAVLTILRRPHKTY